MSNDFDSVAKTEVEVEDEAQGLNGVTSLTSNPSLRQVDDTESNEVRQYSVLA